MKTCPTAISLLMIALTWGCTAGPNPIPDSLNGQIDKSLSFSQLLDNPDPHIGKIIMLGGQVLQAKRLTEATRIEVLHLPLDESKRPSSQRTSSLGRFLAYQQQFLDPATLSDQPHVTIVGEVTGLATAKLDETEYRYPTIDVKHMHVWKAENPDQQQGFGVGLGIGGGSGGFGGGIGIGTGF